MTPNRATKTIWDDELPGLGLRIFISGKRSQIIQYRLRGLWRRTLERGSSRPTASLKDVEFDGLIDNALETTKRTLQRDFDIDAAQFLLNRPGATRTR